MLPPEFRVMDALWLCRQKSATEKPFSANFLVYLQEVFFPLAPLKATQMETWPSTSWRKGHSAPNWSLVASKAQRREGWSVGPGERMKEETESKKKIRKKIESPLDQKCPFRQALRQRCMHRRGKAEVWGWIWEGQHSNAARYIWKCDGWNGLLR